MKITTSYAVEILHINKMFRKTIKIYQDAVSFCIEKLEMRWPELKELDKLRKIQYADMLLHSTNDNDAMYDFDKKFPKTPSYLRRSAIQEAIGALSSYHTRLEQWEETNKTSGRPFLQKRLHVLPVFYKDNMYKENLSKNEAQLKVFINNDWNWITVKLKPTDIKYIKVHCTGKMSVPILERKNKKWFLRFSFDENIKLNTKKLEEQRVLAVDLGINTDATCSVMTKNGAILGRKFINFANDKDQIYRTLNKIKKVQKRYGSHNTKKLWRYATMRNNELSRKISKAIVDYAIEQNCDIIVFEHLDTKGKKSGSKKQKLHLWRKNTIQNIVTGKSHKNGIRISRICAWGTSKLAFDGSGNVERYKCNYSICKFPNGKQYNCDLSASYNIGARYFIRAIEKTMNANSWSDIVAKVPECQKRTNCTYSTLLRINAA